MKAFTILILTLVFGIAAKAEVKIGIYDMQKTLQSTGAGKKAKKELEDSFNKKKAELQEKEAKLKKMKEDLDKKSMVMSDEVKQKKAIEFQEEYGKLQESVMRSQQDIKQQEIKLTEPIIEKIKDVVASIGEKEDYTIILEKSENGVTWAKKGLNLTDRIIALVNEGKGKKQ